MGSWNKTCGLSRLHITAGTPVYIFVLEREEMNDSHCYTTAFYRPNMLPFYGKYDDYGGGEDCHGVAIPYIEKGLQESLIEMEVGDNEYHDIAVKREGFDVTKFFEATHEHRLFIKPYRDIIPVDFVMFRADVVDNILDTLVLKEYVGAGKGNHGEDNCYVQYNYEEVINSVGAFLIDFKKEIEKSTSLFGIGAHSMMVERAIWGMRDKHLAARYVMRETYRYGSIIRPLQIVIDLLQEQFDDQAKLVLIELIKAAYIDSYMDSIRHIWHPGGLEGSQQQEHNGYHVLISTMQKVLEQEKQLWDEDYE